MASCPHVNNQKMIPWRCHRGSPAGKLSQSEQLLSGSRGDPRALLSMCICGTSTPKISRGEAKQPLSRRVNSQLEEFPSTISLAPASPSRAPGWGTKGLDVTRSLPDGNSKVLVNSTESARPPEPLLKE